MEMSYRAAGLALALVFSFLSGKHAQDTIVPAIFTFGDSAMDVGNNDYLSTIYKADYPPYGRDFASHKPTGRFSNGKLVSDIIGEYLGFKSYIPAYLSPDASGENLLSGASFASAASGYDAISATKNRAITLPQQLQYFKNYKSKLTKLVGPAKSESIIKDALYFLSAGTGDFLVNYYVNPRLNRAYTPDQYSSYLVRAFSGFVKDLYGLGARRIGVTSLLPLGCIPAARKLFGSQETGCVARINSDAQNFNKKINSSALVLRKQLPGLKIVVFDIFNPVYNIVNSPLKNGFMESGTGCCKTGTVHEATSLLLCNPKVSATCANATQYVFWDGIHLSEAANQKLADALFFEGISLI